MPEIQNTWLKYAPPPKPLKEGQQWNVFLSYRSVNRTWVINLYDVLRAHGHRVFLDQVAMAAGEALVGSLEHGLERSQAGVLVWSSATADSKWVRREYETMEQLSDRSDFRFVPTRLDATPLPVFAATRIFLDFSQYPDGPNGGELLRLLHAIVGLPLTAEAVRFADAQDEASRRFTARIRAAVSNGAGAELQKMFAAGGLPWETSAALGCAAAEGLTKLKQYEAAGAMLSALEARFPRAIRPKQLRALALARLGGDGLDEAQSILGELYELGERDPETLGIYGRTWMDRYAKSGDIMALRRSRDLYAEAFSGAQDDYYTGINAAAKSTLLGTTDDCLLGRDIAQRVQKLIGTAPVRNDYWKTATVAEVQLILGNYMEAGLRYGDAVAMAPSEKGSHESTWLQAYRLMLAAQPIDADRIRVRQAFSHLPDPPSGVLS